MPSKLTRLDVYEKLRTAHTQIKHLGGNVMGGHLMQEAMIEELDLTPKELKTSFKLIGEIRDRLYKLETIYARE